MPLSSHATRWLVALIAAPILIWAILGANPVVIYVIVGLAGAVAWHEFWCIGFKDIGRPDQLIAGLGGFAAVFGGVLWLGGVGLIGGLAVALGLTIAYGLLRYRTISSIIDVSGRLALGALYVSLGFSCLAGLFKLDHGPFWVLFALLVTFLGDTSAYYTGKNLGRRLLYPAVSPKKTWEGLLGNMGGCGVVAAVFAGILLPVSWVEAGVLGLFLGLWGTGGDLFESMLKREAGLKDSGRVLLGHGGILDRVDALLFNAPLIFVFAQFRMI